jgi:23S rRNA (adenine2030-N6)-methyltransferase
MNYRHAFHAGNAADVFKHMTLCAVLGRMREKPAPFGVVDTHAGAGLYVLDAERNEAEWQHGIGRLWPRRMEWPAFNAYFALIERLNPVKGRLQAYPGSPLFIRELLRDVDRAVFIERQPEECDVLRANLRRATGVAVHCTDGWDAGLAALPLREKRGLILVDPSYELPNEFTRVVRFLRDAVQRMRGGVMLAWYPIKSPIAVERLHNAARALAKETGISVCALELLTLPEDAANRLNGSGLIMLNPPWKLAETLRDALTPVAEVMAGPQGRPVVRLTTLAPSSFRASG